MKKLPDIQKEHIILILLVGMIILKIMQINSWTDMALGAILGWLFGVKMEQIRKQK